MRLTTDRVSRFLIPALLAVVLAGCGAKDEPPTVETKPTGVSPDLTAEQKAAMAAQKGDPNYDTMPDGKK